MSKHNEGNEKMRKDRERERNRERVREREGKMLNRNSQT